MTPRIEEMREGQGKSRLCADVPMWGSRSGADVSGGVDRHHMHDLGRNGSVGPIIIGGTFYIGREIGLC